MGPAFYQLEYACCYKKETLPILIPVANSEADKL